jgi:hypothetical protein
MPGVRMALRMVLSCSVGGAAMAGTTSQSPPPATQAQPNDMQEQRQGSRAPAADAPAVPANVAGDMQACGTGAGQQGPTAPLTKSQMKKQARRERCESSDEVARTKLECGKHQTLSHVLCCPMCCKIAGFYAASWSIAPGQGALYAVELMIRLLAWGCGKHIHKPITNQP